MPQFTASTPMIAAVLDPNDYSRVAAAGDGCFSLVNSDSVRGAIRTVRERPVDAMLVSLDRCSGEASALLEQFSRSFPAVPTIALLTSRGPGDAQALLRLGATGIRQVIDASEATGWHRLRELLGNRSSERSALIIAPALAALGRVRRGGRRFWEELVRSAPATTTVSVLADNLMVRPSTLVSRFTRAGLPSPKDHLVAVRLCYAARLFDEGDHTVGDVAYQLEYASPQSFGRHLRSVLGITPSEFRSRFPFAVMLDRFLDRLVRPHLDVWSRFNPLAPGRGS